MEENKKEQTEIITNEENSIENSPDNLQEVKPAKPNWKKSLWQFMKFVLFSCGAGIIQFGVCTLLFEVAHLYYWLSYVIGLVLSVIYNFTINKKFTFKEVTNIPKAMLLVTAYYAVFTPLSTLWGAALTDGRFLEIPIMQGLGWNMFAVLVPTMVINMVTEFLYWKFFIFRKKKKKTDDGEKADEVSDIIKEETAITENTVKENSDNN